MQEEVRGFVGVGVPPIIVYNKWSTGSVRETCIKHNLYTRGNNEEYQNMLFNMVDKMNPNPINIFKVADDICKHSEDQTVSNIMFLLANEAVKTFFEVKGVEE